MKKDEARIARLLHRQQPDWMTAAACIGLVTPEFDPWHPDPAEGDPKVLYGVARRVCAHCPVRLDCLRDGLRLLETGEIRGMWGGLTPGELRDLARSLRLPSRKVAQHGTRARYVAGCRCDLCTWSNSHDEHERRTAASLAGLAFGRDST